MGRPAIVILMLLIALFVALPAGLLVYAVTRPCPEVWMVLGPGVEVVCPWWDITCHKCY